MITCDTNYLSQLGTEISSYVELSTQHSQFLNTWSLAFYLHSSSGLRFGRFIRPISILKWSLRWQSTTTTSRFGRFLSAIGRIRGLVVTRTAVWPKPFGPLIQICFEGKKFLQISTLSIVKLLETKNIFLESPKIVLR